METCGSSKTEASPVIGVIKERLGGRIFGRPQVQLRNAFIILNCTFIHILRLSNTPVAFPLAHRLRPLNMSFRFLARSARPLVSQATETRVPLSFRAIQQGRPVTAFRSYSAATDSAAKEDAVASENAEKQAEATKEDPTLKELEAKKKEVADVTVRS